jgi:hypothetical protein
MKSHLLQLCAGFLVWNRCYTSVVSILLPFHYIATNWHDVKTVQNSFTSCGLVVFCSWYSVNTEWKFRSAFFIGRTDVIYCMCMTCRYECLYIQ